MQFGNNKFPCKIRRLKNGQLQKEQYKIQLTVRVLLWPPCVADAVIIFLPCGFFLLLFYSSPNLSGRRLDVYHTSTHGVPLVRI